MTAVRELKTPQLPAATLVNNSFALFSAKLKQANFVTFPEGGKS